MRRAGLAAVVACVNVARVARGDARCFPPSAIFVFRRCRAPVEGRVAIPPLAAHPVRCCPGVGARVVTGLSLYATLLGQSREMWPCCWHV